MILHTTNTRYNTDNTSKYIQETIKKKLFVKRTCVYTDINIHIHTYT